MAHRRRVAIVAIIGIAWLSQIVYLFPLPSTQLDRYVQLQARLFEAGNAPTRPSESKQAYLERTRQSAAQEFWSGWFVTLTTTLLGLFSAIALALQWRASAALVLLSSGAYVLSWLMFNGVLASELSVVAMYKDMWESAQVLNTQLIFLHRSVILLSLFSVLSIIAAVLLIVRRS